MGGGFQFFDIIFFALVAAFVILRLRSVLGKRTGHEQKPGDPFGRRRLSDRKDAEARAPDRDEDETVVRLPGREGQTIASNTPLGAGLTQIRVADPSFDPADFVEKAKMAFSYIVGAYAAGETEALKPLLAPDVFEGFAGAIRERQQQGHQSVTEVERFRDVTLIEAGMSGRIASITVRYVTDQINVTRDREGQVIEGNPDITLEVTDIWTFERDTGSSDPNWILMATDVPH